MPEYGYTIHRNYDQTDTVYAVGFGPLPQITDVDRSSHDAVDWSRDNYDFLGWNTLSNASGTMYQPGDTQAGRQVFAIWKNAVVVPDITISYNGDAIASLSDSGTEVLETNGKLCEDDITIDYTKPSPYLQLKVVNPSTSGQTIYPDGGYDGLSQVSVAAISPTKSAQTYTPTTTDQTIASGRWLTGAQTIKGDANLVASNIKKDVQIFGITGSYEGSAPTINLQSKSASPTTSSQTITADSGYDGLSSVTVDAMPSGSINLERTRGKNEGVAHTLDSDNGQLIESVRYTIEAHADVTPGYIQYSSTSDTPCRFTNYYTFDNQVPATVYTPTTYDQRIMTKGCFITGTQTVKGDSNLTSYNIKNGVTIFGVTGTYNGDTYIFDYSSDVVCRGFSQYHYLGVTFIADWNEGRAWISGLLEWEPGAEVGEIDFTGIDEYNYLIDDYTDTFWLINAWDPTEIVTQGTYSDGVFSVDASYIADPSSATPYYLVQISP